MVQAPCKGSLIIVLLGSRVQGSGLVVRVRAMRGLEGSGHSARVRRVSDKVREGDSGDIVNWYWMGTGYPGIPVEFALVGIGLDQGSRRQLASVKTPTVSFLRG